MVDSVLEAFEEANGHAPEFVIRAPGRINIIGEHTDYNNGLVLAGAIDKALYLAVGFNDTNKLRFWALDINRKAVISIEKIRKTNHLWVDYLLGIADQFQSLGFNLRGIDVVFGGDLPIGAGVSSSAAMECGMLMAWNEIAETRLNRLQMAKLAQYSSQQFLGIPCGIMDQFASLHGKKNKVILLDCNDLSFTYQSAEIKGCEWVLLNTKVSHELANSEYPLRVQECQAGLAKLQAHFPDVSNLRDATIEQLDAIKNELVDKAYARCQYVIEEHGRTLKMLEALAEGDAKKVGQLLEATHQGLRDQYEVSCPEIDVLFTFAQNHPAVYGSRLMGGGFGGCTLNLVKTDQKIDFIQAALTHYHQQTGKEGTAFDVQLSDGVEVLDV